MLPLLLCAALHAEPRDEVRALLSAGLPASEVEPLLTEAERAANRAAARLAPLAEPAQVRERVWRAIAENLRGKQAALPGAEVIGRTVIGYEAFKLETYATSGVFPKRYFGYLDGRGDTAAWEIRAMHAVRAAAGVLNAWQAERGRAVRLSEADLVVTFLAEGGAWFLGERQDLLGGLHPVLDVGLDNLASGLEDLPELRDRLDAAAGTDLKGLVAWTGDGASSSVPDRLRWLQHGNGDAGPFPYLTRLMTLEEAVVGTALMALWEKEIAAELVLDGGWAPLETRPADEQFIILSLVYNSGLVFGPERWEQIRSFSTGDYLFDRSEANAAGRGRLNLLPPAALLAELVPDGAYREQPTAWSAVYHVLQRYGAWESLRRFGDVFDGEGRFLMIPAPPPEPPPPPPPPAEPPPRRGWVGAALFGLLAGLGLWRLRGR